MPTIKCIGCYDLLREEIETSKELLISYNCPRFFPQCYTLSGILRPGKRLIDAVQLCPEKPLKHCILCSERSVGHYGEDIAAACEEHDRAWGEWLEKHPDRRAWLGPKGRPVKANWVEVLREFIEDMRREVEGG